MCQTGTAMAMGGGLRCWAVLAACMNVWMDGKQRDKQLHFVGS